MGERPESVTVIGWLLVVFGAFGLLGCLLGWSIRDWPALQQTLASYHYPLSFQTMMEIGILGTTVRLLCAVGILRRMGWTRHLYLAWSVLMAAYALWIGPWPLFVLPSILFSLVVAVLLFRPAANRWFAGEDVAAA